MDRNKVLLIILDGWGISPISEGNATLLAKTPVLDYIYASYPKMLLSASGLEVGLNRGEMGNSEVGHLNIGSGRVVWENLPRIDYQIDCGGIFENKNLLNTLSEAKESRLHLIGLVSGGGVHSHIRHLKALLNVAKKQGVGEVYVHFISDGRDTPQNVSADYAKELEEEIKKISIGKISTIIGRYYAMDRDKRWDRTAKAYNLYFSGEGAEYGTVFEAINSNYAAGHSDEFIEPSVIDKNGMIKDGDSVIFFNFRADRMRQIVESFVTENFSNFTIPKNPSIYITTMTEYEKSYAKPVLFEAIDLLNVLADVLEKNNKAQYHIAETEKYAHVTYFFNGGREDKHQKETQTVVPSPKVATYDLQPEMSAQTVSEKTIEAIENEADFIVVNYANGDMVGHTGKLDATIKACETVDKCLFGVLNKASNLGYNTIITADHGNCEIMIDPATSLPCTEHTTSPVPFVYLDFKEHPFNSSVSYSFSPDDMITYSTEPCRGVLSDIASTILSIMKIDCPKEMEGINLIEGME